MVFKLISRVMMILLLIILLVSFTNGQEKITLSILTHSTLEEPAGTAFREVINEFEKLHPEVKIELIEATIEDIYVKQITLIAAGEIPDIIDMPQIEKFIELDAIEPLTEYVKKKGGDSFINQFFPGQIVACKSFDGTLYALPLYTSPYGVYYRTDHFEEAGLDPHNPPKTFEEFVNTAKALTRDLDGDGLVDQYGFTLHGAKTGSAIRFINYLQGAGGDMLIWDENMQKWLIECNSPESIKGFKFFIDLHRVHHVVPPNVLELGYGENVNLFAQGKVSMVVNGPHGAGAYTTANPELEGKFLVGPMPVESLEIKAKAMGEPTLYSMSSKSKHKDLAWEFLKFLTITKATRWSELTHMAVCTIEAANSDFSQNDPFLPIFYEALHEAEAPRWRVLPESLEIQEAWTDIIQIGLSGQLNPEECMNELANRLQNILGDKAINPY